jgi:hypothetical protein
MKGPVSPSKTCQDSPYCKPSSAAYPHRRLVSLESLCSGSSAQVSQGKAKGHIFSGLRAGIHGSKELELESTRTTSPHLQSSDMLCDTQKPVVTEFGYIRPAVIKSPTTRLGKWTQHNSTVGSASAHE